MTWCPTNIDYVSNMVGASWEAGAACPSWSLLFRKSMVIPSL